MGLRPSAVQGRVKTLFYATTESFLDFNGTSRLWTLNPPGLGWRDRMKTPGRDLRTLEELKVEVPHNLTMRESEARRD